MLKNREIEPSKYTTLDGHKVRQYWFPTTPIPRLDFRDPTAQELIAREEPVVLTGTGLVQSAVNRWNLDYLKQHYGGGDNNVFLSENGKFMYFDERRANAVKNFKAPTEREVMTFDEFYKRLKRWKKGDKKLYFQQMLSSTVTEQVVLDFLAFNWKWLTEQQAKHSWGPLTSNLLLIGMSENITPAHYDEQQNFFAQVSGYKRCVLFHPSQFKFFYPYPFHHPCDRQSQVDFDHPDFKQFPLLSKIHGREAVVKPGDVLYIPMYWWHYIESVADDRVTISVNFWYKGGPSPTEVMHPLSAQQKIAVMRNIEKLLGDALGDPSEIGTLLNTLVQGRYHMDESYPQSEI